MLWVHSVCPYPATDGNRIRHFGLLAAIAQDHDITLVCPVTDAEMRKSGTLRALCRLVPVPTRARPFGWWADVSRRTRELQSGHPTCMVPAELSEMAAAVRTLAADQSFDAVFTSLYVAPAAFEAATRRTVVDDQNVEALLYRRLWNNERRPVRRVARLLDWRLVRQFERRWLRAADAVTVCSAQDRQMLVEHITGLPPVDVVPNGVGAVTPRTDRAEKRTVIFVGGLGYEPNADAARFLLGQVMPRIRRTHPDVQTLIVGKSPPADIREAAGSSVEVTGEVLSTKPYLAQAAVAVVPLRSGGGTRLKILEAVAAGVPVVATGLAVEGLGFRPDEEVLIADDADGLAAHVSSLLSNPGRGQAMAAQAAQRVRERYQWTAISKGLVDVLAAPPDQGREGRR